MCSFCFVFILSQAYHMWYEIKPTNSPTGFVFWYLTHTHIHIYTPTRPNWRGVNENKYFPYLQQFCITCSHFNRHAYFYRIFWKFQFDSWAAHESYTRPNKYVYEQRKAHCLSHSDNHEHFTLSCWALDLSVHNRIIKHSYQNKDVFVSSVLFGVNE